MSRTIRRREKERTLGGCFSSWQIESSYALGNGGTPLTDIEREKESGEGPERTEEQLPNHKQRKCLQREEEELKIALDERSLLQEEVRALG